MTDYHTTSTLIPKLHYAYAFGPHRVPINSYYLPSETSKIKMSTVSNFPMTYTAAPNNTHHDPMNGMKLSLSNLPIAPSITSSKSDDNDHTSNEDDEFIYHESDDTSNESHEDGNKDSDSMVSPSVVPLRIIAPYEVKENYGPLGGGGGGGGQRKLSTNGEVKFINATGKVIHRKDQPKKRRTRTTEDQNRILREHFSHETMPSSSSRHALGLKVGMTSRQVQVWFQNQRANAKKLAKKNVESPDKSLTPASNSPCNNFNGSLPNRSLSMTSETKESSYLSSTKQQGSSMEAPRLNYTVRNTLSHVSANSIPQMMINSVPQISGGNPMYCMNVNAVSSIAAPSSVHHLQPSSTYTYPRGSSLINTSYYNIPNHHHHHHNSVPQFSTDRRHSYHEQQQQQQPPLQYLQESSCDDFHYVSMDKRNSMPFLQGYQAFQDPYSIFPIMTNYTPDLVPEADGETTKDHVTLHVSPLDSSNTDQQQDDDEELLNAYINPDGGYESLLEDPLKEPIFCIKLDSSSRETAPESHQTLTKHSFDDCGILGDALLVHTKSSKKRKINASSKY